MSRPSSAPLRIGLDARFYRGGTGGIGRYTRELISHLARLDTFNQYTVFITPADLPEWQPLPENFKMVVVPAKHYSFAEQAAFLRVLLKAKLDLVHFLNFNHPLLYRRPFVTSVHDLTIYLFPVGKSQTSKLKRLAFIGVLKHALSSSKRILTDSENTAADAQKYMGVFHAKMEVISLGGPERETARFAEKAQIIEYLGTKEPYFLFVSQWRPHKGILTLIAAFSQFKQATGLPHKLVLIGKQDVLEDEVKTALTTTPHYEDILMPGYAPEELLPSLYRYATACVIPSEYEGFGLPVLEAFNYEVPVIVADNSSLPEVAGNAALYFPTRDDKALAARMADLAESKELRADLVAKGLIQLKKFSWGETARRTLAVYRSVLEKTR